MRVGEVRRWQFRRCRFVAMLLTGASLLALLTVPAADAAPARDAAAKVVKCRAGTSAWKFNKRTVCLATKLRARPLQPVAAAVGGVLRDVLFDDKLERTARKYSRSRAVRRSSPLGKTLRAALGPGGTAAVAKGVERIVQRLTAGPLASSAARRGRGRLRASAAANDGSDIPDPKVDANGNFSVGATLEMPDGSSVSVGASGKVGKEGVTEAVLELGLKSGQTKLPDGTTAQARFSVGMPFGGDLPSCPAADGTLSGKQRFKSSTTLIIKRGTKIVSSHTKTIAITSSVRAFVGDDGRLSYADIDTTLDSRDAQSIREGLISGPLVLESAYSASGRLDGGALRAGDATPYTVSNSGAEFKRTVGISFPFLIDPKRDSKVFRLTAEELAGKHGDLIKTLMSFMVKDLRRAEKNWYDDEACVKVSASAASDADPSEVIPVTLSEVKAADGKQFKAGVAASGTASITPGAGTYTPGASTDFKLTVPAERGSNGTWKLVATGKGGKKTISGSVAVRKEPADPPTLSGTIGGHVSLDDGGSPISITWAGSVDLVRRPTQAGTATVYDLKSLTLTAVDYLGDVGSCLFMGRDTPTITAGPAPGMAGVMVVEPGASPTYRIGLQVTSGSINGVLSVCAQPSLNGTPHSFDLTGLLLLNTPTPQCSVSRFGFGPANLLGSTSEYEWTWLLGDAARAGTCA